MTIKTIIHPVTGQPFHLGRLRPSIEALGRPRLRLGKYFTPDLPPPPAGPLGRYEAIPDVIKQLYGNNDYGDCTIAGKFHLCGTFTGLANPPPMIFTDQQAVADYMRLTGGTDDGLDEITVLEDWRSGTGPISSAHEIAGFASVDATNQQHVQFAVWAFLNGYLGLELPDAYISPMPSKSGFVWDVAGDPNPDSGHCVVVVDFTPQGLIILTWGMWGILTWKAAAKYLSNAGQGEFHVIWTEESIIKASLQTPSGFDFTQLSTDANLLQ